MWPKENRITWVRTEHSRFQMDNNPRISDDRNRALAWQKLTFCFTTLAQFPQPSRLLCKKQAFPVQRNKWKGNLFYTKTICNVEQWKQLIYERLQVVACLLPPDAPTMEWELEPSRGQRREGHDRTTVKSSGALPACRTRIQLILQAKEYNKTHVRVAVSESSTGV